MTRLSFLLFKRGKRRTLGGIACGSIDLRKSAMEEPWNTSLEQNDDDDDESMNVDQKCSFSQWIHMFIELLNHAFKYIFSF